MLSYQHEFHAGCFADVFKHVLLTRILTYMTLKEAPLFYLETHSGRGHYDLQSAAAMKTREAEQGIQVLWDQLEKLPELFTPYVDICRQLNDSEQLRFYPGSPFFAKSLLRPQDRIYLCERHPTEFKYLKAVTQTCDFKRTVCFQGDGMTQLKATLPPKERRGLIFIDPSFEVKAEYTDIPKALAQAYQRFPTGVYCVWYPIVDAQLHRKWIQSLNAIKAPALKIEWTSSRPGLRMNQCGLWVINPPYILQQEAEKITQALDLLE